MFNYEVIWKDKRHSEKKNVETFTDLMIAIKRTEDLISLGFDAWLVLCNNALEKGERKIADFHVIK